jgi:uncharacterized protein YukE
MRPVTTRIPDDTHRILEDMAGEQDRSVSEFVRENVEKGLEVDEREGELREEYEKRIADLRQENERLQGEIERLRDQLAATNRRVDQHQDLVAYVEEQRELEHRRAEREERRAKAGVLTRTKWWLTGMSSEEDDE